MCSSFAFNFCLVLSDNVLKELRANLENNLVTDELLASEFENEVASVSLSGRTVTHGSFVLFVEQSETVIPCWQHLVTGHYAFKHNQSNCLRITFNTFLSVFLEIFNSIFNYILVKVIFNSKLSILEPVDVAANIRAQ